MGYYGYSAPFLIRELLDRLGVDSLQRENRDEHRDARSARELTESHFVSARKVHRKLSKRLANREGLYKLLGHPTNSDLRL